MTRFHHTRAPRSHPRQVRTRARAARCLLILGTLFLCAAPFPPAPCLAAGPKTTARLLASANAMNKRPLAERVPAYRVVLGARKRLDANAFRALRKLSTLYAKSGEPHANTAVIAWSVMRHAKNERGTFKARIRLATALRKEGDLQAAALLYESILKNGARVASDAAARALRDYSADLLAAQDVAGLRTLARHAERLRSEPVTHIVVAGRLGEALLRQRKEREARRLHTRCQRLYESTQKGDPDVARKAAKAWLDLPLRRALADVR